jgi:hypothetical protein
MLSVFSWSETFPKLLIFDLWQLLLNLEPISQNNQSSMFTHFTGWAIVTFIIYLIIVALSIWFAYRFVKAHESIAETLESIEEKLSDATFESNH